MGSIIFNIFGKIIPKELKNFIKNLRNLSGLNEEITGLKREVLFLRILHYFENNSAQGYTVELKYLKKTGGMATYPYNRTTKEQTEVKSGYDKKKKMSFIVHKEKKLYFPGRFSEEAAKKIYLNLVVREDILGDGFMEKSPHCYITESFSVKEDNIVVDIGACEGLFSLDAIDKAKKCFVVEPKKHWIKALRATFEPYKDKVTIIKKFASGRDSKDEMTIDSCLKDESGDIFIKIDVEGSEYSVLSGAKEALQRNSDIRVACATYHRHDDANLFEDFFKNINYHTEFSDGYMLFASYDKIKPPFFRKGMIRAQKIKSLTD